jgi:hypothetical protein
MTDMTSILKKIRALRARAADSASTEAEAAMAARLAAKLLEDHNITLTDVEVKAEGVGKQTWDSGLRDRPSEIYACKGIEALCGVKTWRTDGVVHILGAPADVETALYFMDLVRGAMRRCWASFQRSDDFGLIQARTGKTTQSIGHGFRIGVAGRLGERMTEMANEAKRARASTGTALVVVKDQLINEWLREKKMKFSTPSRATFSESGYTAGRSAANNVPLNRGVGRSGGFARIG